MTKIEEVRKALKATQIRLAETEEYVSQMVLAQSKTAVLVMTLLQMMLEKNLFERSEVEKRLQANESLVMDEEGNCIAPMTSIIYGDDEKTGDE